MLIKFFSNKLSLKLKTDMKFHSRSIVLEIKAAEITATERMPFGYNLRFPRVTAIRSHADKPPNDCTTGQLTV